MERRDGETTVASMLDPERVESTMGIRGLLRCLPVLSIALITFVAFSPALRNGFVNWDDLETLVENQNFRGLSWSHLLWMFTTFHQGHYQPLSWITFSLDYLLWGMEPFGYHLTNIVLHSANAVLFYFVSRRLLTIAAPISSAVVVNLSRGIFRACFCHSSAAG